MKTWILTLLLTVLPAAAAPIEDNSLLLEEAYNQKPGVVQFIMKYEHEKSKGWKAQFENEIPLSGQAHQISYSVPYERRDSENDEGFGDVSVSYRYQLMKNESTAIAPRIGLVGAGGLGAEFNFAASFKLNPRWVLHANAGANFRRDELENTYGLSAVYHCSESFDVMLESKGEGEDMFLAPGVRAAFNRGSWQMVPGLAYSYNVKPNADDSALIAYLSAESPF